MQVKLLHFRQKKVGYHITVALTIHSYVTIRSIFEEERSNDVRTKLWLFPNELVGFAILLADLYSKIDNSAYLRTYVEPKMSFVAEHTFSIQKLDLQRTFQEPIHQQFSVAVGRSASIFALAVF